MFLLEESLKLRIHESATEPRVAQWTSNALLRRMSFWRSGGRFRLMESGYTCHIEGIYSRFQPLETSRDEAVMRSKGEERVVAQSSTHSGVLLDKE